MEKSIFYIMLKKRVKFRQYDENDKFLGVLFSISNPVFFIDISLPSWYALHVQ